MNTYKAIAAMSENRVIGNSGDIPWHLPKDFKWFKKTTMGAILVMGRKTYESIGRPLPGRDTYVLSRQPREIPGVHSFTDLEALDHLKTDQTIWIAGGGEVYKQMLHKCSELYLTRVHRTVEGDAFFPEFEDRFKLDSIIEKDGDFTIERWVKN
ncbi:MAG: dihydrofolate reductase [Puniceicoccaceae bacterium]|jgi:dihydrofolate reductase|nr:dihydrofolate reductase [Puniceicoccaceae bacterium]MBL6838462.1 dihydrofolate reductase [Puniceicoccaceae bacterium]MBL6913189.1 dihydrofolate reductase [Puniceicoccaceae bacterium]HAZ00531.1 dihydrofolate reductase [Opitutae bacterium]